MRDPLTGAWSRDEWPALVEKASSLAAERGTWAALVDVDHFKRFNGHNGHGAGDRALVELAQFLVSLERDGGIQVVRTGGQEFALICLGGETAEDQDGRATCARILRWARESLTPEQPKDCGQPGCVGPTLLTLSLALARIEPGESSASLSERLAVAVQRAKAAGRDRLESA
jgi:diguanylate cyclase (GGDEF)-like protein